MRTEIKNRIIECLKNKTVVGENIFFMRKGITSKPFISLFFNDETVSEYTIAPKTTRRELNFTIESILEGDIKKIECFFDVIIDQVETLMNQLDEFDLKYKGVRFEVDSEAKTVGLFSMDYSLSYLKDEKTEIDSTDLNKFKIMEIVNE